MKKYIYKITNKINNKKYIGQTSNWERRKKEHWRHTDNGAGKLLYLAMDKYGIENFDFEVIEYVENYNEREKYWIAYYNTLATKKDSNGYNLTPGGEEPPIHAGDNSYTATLNNKLVNEIKQLLLEGNLTAKQLAEQYNCNLSTISRINNGTIRYDSNLKYPLNEKITLEYQKQSTKQLADNIINDLLNSNLTQREIAEKYNVARTCVTAINRAQIIYNRQYDYTILKHNQHSKKIDVFDAITNEYLGTYDSIKEAAAAYNLKKGSVSACARGISKKTTTNLMFKYHD